MARCIGAAIALVLVMGLCSCATIRGGVTRKTIAAEYYAIAEAYSELGKYDKAIPYYEKAAAVKDYRNAARYGLGRMYGLSNEWDKAADIFESLLKKDSGNEMLRSAYAFSLASLGNGEKALPLYRELMDMRPDDPERVRNYAEVQIIAKEYQAALDTIASARERFPDSDVLKDLDDLEAKATAALAPSEDESAAGADSEKGEGKESAAAPRKDAKKAPADAKESLDAAKKAEPKTEAQKKDTPKKASESTKAPAD